MKKDLVSIIIPNWFTEAGGKIAPTAEAFWFAQQCIPRIKEYTKNFELILIDNGSVLGSDYLKEQAMDGGKFFRNETNLGFAKAVNQGIILSEGEWVCVINNDVFVWPGWMEALKLTFTDNPTCGIAMPALVKDVRKAREALAIEMPDLHSNYGIYGAHAEFGSCWLTRRINLDKLKDVRGYYLDENFQYGFGEDRDLWKAVRYYLNLETYRTHNTRIFHQGNTTIGKIPNRKIYTSANREYLKEKWDKILATQNSVKSVDIGNNVPNLEEPKNIKMD
jgi:glycosyltransferase involved in cell wall biosynthesis